MLLAFLLRIKPSLCGFGLAFRIHTLLPVCKFALNINFLHVELPLSCSRFRTRIPSIPRTGRSGDDGLLRGLEYFSRDDLQLSLEHRDWLIAMHVANAFIVSD